MNAIPAYIADLLVTTYANIQSTGAVTSQRVEDVYKDRFGRLVKRIFTLTSSVKNGAIWTNFTLEEIPPQAIRHRVDLDFIDDVYVDADILFIRTGEAKISFGIKTEE